MATTQNCVTQFPIFGNDIMCNCAKQELLRIRENNSKINGFAGLLEIDITSKNCNNIKDSLNNKSNGWIENHIKQDDVALIQNQVEKQNENNNSKSFPFLRKKEIMIKNDNNSKVRKNQRCSLMNIKPSLKKQMKLKNKKTTTLINNFPILLNTNLKYKAHFKNKDPSQPGKLMMNSKNLNPIRFFNLNNKCKLKKNHSDLFINDNFKSAYFENNINKNRIILNSSTSKNEFSNNKKSENLCFIDKGTESPYFPGAINNKKVSETLLNKNKKSIQDNFDFYFKSKKKYSLKVETRQNHEIAKRFGSNKNHKENVGEKFMCLKCLKDFKWGELYEHEKLCSKKIYSGSKEKQDLSLQHLNKSVHNFF